MSKESICYKPNIGVLSQEQLDCQIGETFRLYKEAVETAFELIDKLQSLGIESAPWVRHDIKSGGKSKYGNYLYPGPKLRLEIR